MEAIAKYFYEKGTWDENEIYNLVKLEEISEEIYEELVGIEYKE